MYTLLAVAFLLLASMTPAVAWKIGLKTPPALATRDSVVSAVTAIFDATAFAYSTAAE